MRELLGGNVVGNVLKVESFIVANYMVRFIIVAMVVELVAKVYEEDGDIHSIVPVVNAIAIVEDVVAINKVLRHLSNETHVEVVMQEVVLVMVRGIRVTEINGIDKSVVVSAPTNLDPTIIPDIMEHGEPHPVIDEVIPEVLHLKRIVAKVLPTTISIILLIVEQVR